MQHSHVMCMTVEAEIVGKSSNDVDAIMTVNLPQSLSLPTCIHPSSTEWQAMQSAQMREWQSQTIPEVERRDSHVESWNRKTVSQRSEAEEIKICAFPGEWLWICHALYWQLLVYSLPSFFFIWSSVFHVPVIIKGWPLKQQNDRLDNSGKEKGFNWQVSES